MPDSCSWGMAIKWSTILLSKNGLDCFATGRFVKRVVGYSCGTLAYTHLPSQLKDGKVYGDGTISVSGDELLIRAVGRKTNVETSDGDRNVWNISAKFRTLRSINDSWRPPSKVKCKGSKNRASNWAFMENVNLLRRSEFTAYKPLTTKTIRAVFLSEALLTSYREKFMFDTKHSLYNWCQYIINVLLTQR